MFLLKDPGLTVFALKHPTQAVQTIPPYLHKTKINQPPREPWVDANLKSLFILSNRRHQVPGHSVSNKVGAWPLALLFKLRFELD